MASSQVPHFAGPLPHVRATLLAALAGVLVSAESLALVRVGGRFFGVVGLAVASLVVPDRVLFSLGVVILFGGVGLSPPYPIVRGPRDGETDEPAVPVPA